jgi:two-component system sensor histidine kinase KdpD
MPIDINRRADPDLLLRRLEEQEQGARRGRLKVFLGYAAGVGKSFQMLDEGRRRRARGEDVVIGIMQARYPPEVMEVVAGHEIVPPLKIGDCEALDIGAILRRRPQVVLIDGLAYDNPPGSPNAKRWQDVEQILSAGVSVIGTINLQYIEELQEEVAAITGRSREQTVPKAFLEQAEEIEIVDVPAEESLQRTTGEAAPADAEQQNKLSRLRELALLLSAQMVDLQLERCLKAHGIEESWGAQERIMVCITPRSNAARMIASGRRNADRFHGELFVVYVQQPNLTAEDQLSLERKLALARQFGARVEIVEAKDSVAAILGFARERGITQIFIGHSFEQGWWKKVWGAPVDRLIRSTEGMDVIVFPH